MILLQPSNHERFGNGGSWRDDQDNESDGEVEEPPDMHLLLSKTDELEDEGHDRVLGAWGEWRLSRSCWI